ncbi:MAG: hypothetical protein J0L82_03135 [Deltaproteobacteria bacterium]|nr:hypothetical protein [Deltaproteobacteria bacterium]
MSESSGSALEQSVRRMFVKWLLFSTAVILAVALISGAHATAADVFIDEGDGDFDKPTPVETPLDTSVQSPVSNTALDLDADFKASPGDSTDASTVVDTATTLPVPTEAVVTEAVEKNASTSTSTAESKTTATTAVPKPIAKAKAEKAVKAVKKASKASVKSEKVATKTGKAKARKKAVAVVKSKKKTVAVKAKATKKSAKRKVASTAKYAGGQYVSTSRECAMESAPGAGDTIGTTKAQRKLWVEDAGDSGYWKVYSKSGQAAFLSRSCF